MYRSASRVAVAMVTAAAVAGSCHALLDIDEVQFGDPATSAGGASGGTSSTGGGSGGEAAHSPGGSGGGTATGGGGAGGAGGAVLGPWGTPQIVEALAEPAADDDDPTFTADLLELHFNSNRPAYGASDIFVSTRATPTDPWGPPVAVTALNTTSTETNPVISPDGLTLWFASDRAAVQDVFVSTRPTRASSWSPPVEVPELNSADMDVPCAATADGLTMIIESDRDGPWNLYLSTRSSTAQAWSTPAPITELNTTHDDMEAWLSADGRQIYFDSDHPDGTQADLFRSSRPSLTSPFEPRIAIGELNTSVSESDPWLSPDQRYIMFVRGPSPRTIYEAFR